MYTGILLQRERDMENLPNWRLKIRAPASEIKYRRKETSEGKDAKDKRTQYKLLGELDYSIKCI